MIIVTLECKKLVVELTPLQPDVEAKGVKLLLEEAYQPVTPTLSVAESETLMEVLYRL
jgi:hypothetical protein